MCRDRTVWFGGHDMREDFIVMDFIELDVLLGIDWLTRHGAVIDCPKRQVDFRTPGSVPCELLGRRFGDLIPIVSAGSAPSGKGLHSPPLRQSPATQLPQWGFRRSQLYPHFLTCFQNACPDDHRRERSTSVLSFSRRVRHLSRELHIAWRLRN